MDGASGWACCGSPGDLNKHAGTGLMPSYQIVLSPQCGSSLQGKDGGGGGERGGVTNGRMKRNEERRRSAMWDEVVV